MAGAWKQLDLDLCYLRAMHGISRSSTVIKGFPKATPVRTTAVAGFTEEGLRSIFVDFQYNLDKHGWLFEQHVDLSSASEVAVTISGIARL